ncbi:MAG TPA: NAD(P)-dependent oxidoreductase [Nitrososphaerales archaeon]|nr:NAD(P)-dependent oxidoreductase [Nitrososphaerales archaeon]
MRPEKREKWGNLTPILMQRVGILGLGLMGGAFAANLLSKGHEVHIYNRTRSKANPLVRKGAILHGTPRELATGVDIAITSLTDHTAVEEVTLGQNGFLVAMEKGSLWVDMSTIDPDVSARHAAEASRLGVKRLDAPVVGGPSLASKGKVLALVGGKEGVYKTYQEFLNELADPVVYLGPDGSGHRMKLAINLYLGLAAESFSEAMVFARKLGFDPRVFVDTFNKTTNRNHYSKTKGPKIAEGNFEPTFSMDNLVKDLRLVDVQREKARLILPLFAVALERYTSAASFGDGGRDYSAIVREIQRLNGMKPDQVSARKTA